ncbi:MAG: hypothetical protein N3G19_02140 [Candidatus Pacearchaeota archaeon]|nr:hypothetical protein [Candidatus Pacearchaeota archaeon]
MRNIGNKKGWLLIVESVIAVLILFGFVFVAMAKYAQESKILREESSLYDVADTLAINVEKNETARIYVFNNPQAIDGYLSNEIERMRLNVEAQGKVCGVEETCLLGAVQKDIYSSEIIIVKGQLVKKLKIFVWQK